MVSAGSEGGCCGAERSVRVTAEGGRSSHQQGGECKGGEPYTSMGATGFIITGMTAVSWEDGGAGGDGGWRGREDVVLGWRR